MIFDAFQDFVFDQHRFTDSVFIFKKIIDCQMLELLKISLVLELYFFDRVAMNQKG